METNWALCSARSGEIWDLSLHGRGEPDLVRRIWGSVGLHWVSLPLDPPAPQPPHVLRGLARREEAACQGEAAVRPGRRLGAQEQAEGVGLDLIPLTIPAPPPLARGRGGH